MGSLQREQSDSERSQQFRTGWDDDLASYALSKRMPDRMVQGHAALKKNLLADVARAFDSIEIIGRNGINEAGDDVFSGIAFLLGNADV